MRNNQQIAYVAARRELDRAREKLAAAEKKFLKAKGRSEERMDDIEDDAEFDDLMAECYSDPQTEALYDDKIAKQKALKAAEDDLIAFGASIIPGKEKETILEASAKNFVIRKKVIELIMRLNTRTV